MRTDYRKTSEEIILDLINHYNAESLSAFGISAIRGNDIVIGVPLAVAGRTTRIRITPKLTAPFVDPFSFTYQRVDMSRFTLVDSDTSFRVDGPGEYRLSEFIAQINQRWGVNLGVRDYIDQAFTIDQYDAVVPLMADPRSLVWYGGINLRVSCGVPLTDLITETDLDGFSTWTLEQVLKITDLDGFSLSLKSLEDLLKHRELDGFNLSPRTLGELLWRRELDGFMPVKTSEVQ
jgi:hypothetical protein